MFIFVLNYLCLKDCHPPELQWCWNESRLVKLRVFCLLGCRGSGGQRPTVPWDRAYERRSPFLSL